MKRIYEYSVKRTYVGACEASEHYSLDNPKSVTNMLKLVDIHSDDQENFMVLLLDTKNRPKGLSRICRGLLDRCHAHPREVFKPAIIAGCSKIILVHNHPSGNCVPSPQDINLTENMIKCGDILGIKVVDHIIVGEMYGEFNSRSMRSYNDVEFK